MQHRQLAFDSGFRVEFGNARGQAAVMVIPPGGREGGPGNRHSGADQWLFVHAGEGEAIVEGRRVSLRPGSLMLIEAGERHEIRNTGEKPLETLNIYLPPAYDREGDALPAGKP